MQSGWEILWLSIGTLGMAIGAVSFAYLGIRAPEGTRHFYALTFAIALIATLAYFAMATGTGVDQAGGETVYSARYIGWVFTSPLILIVLALLALVNWRNNLGLIASLLVLDIVMILMGLWASNMPGGGRYVLWFIATAVLAALLYLVYTRLFAAARTRSDQIQQAFNTLAWLTIVVWSLYPIVWLIGTEGFGAVSPSVEVFLFLVLDLLAKVGFGFLLLTNRQALSDAAGGATVSRVR